MSLKGRAAGYGRQKGTPNKKTAAYKDKLDELGFNCAEEAVKLYRSGELKAAEQAGLLEMITSYTHHKPKLAETVVSDFLEFKAMSELSALDIVESDD